MTIRIVHVIEIGHNLETLKVLEILAELITGNNARLRQEISDKLTALKADLESTIQ